jgi:hypothetical protein
MTTHRRGCARIDCNRENCTAHLEVRVEPGESAREVLVDRARDRGWDVGSRFFGIPTTDYCPRHDRRAA